MRLLRTIRNDIRYQARYGFYLVYALLTALYIGLLLVFAPANRGLAASLILLSDPAVLGYFFIGGIWLLEKDEDLHSYASITPQRCTEYVLGKALSLALISTLSAVVICAATVPGAQLLLLSLSVFIASCVFTLLGLLIATASKSVNGYMLNSTVPATLLIVPALFAAFGKAHFLLEIFPGTLAWRLIDTALWGASRGVPLRLLGLAAWAALLWWLAAGRVAKSMGVEGGAGHAANA